MNNLNGFLNMIDFSKVDNSPINKMAIILGVSAFGVLVAMLIVAKLLQMLKMPNKVISPLISLIGAFSFLYLVVYLGEIML